MPKRPPHPAEIEDRKVCSSCVGEVFLRAAIRKDGEVDACFYCAHSGRTVTIGEMANRIETAFEQHFRQTSTEPSDFEYSLLSDKEGSYDWMRHGTPVVDVIADLAEIGDVIASDIQVTLENRHASYSKAEIGVECPFDCDSHYEESSVSIADLENDWRIFEESLKTETRFFSRVAEATLSSIFSGLQNYKTLKGRRVVLEAGPGKRITAVFRARVFESDDQLVAALARPDLELGPPPPRAARPGRMNAGGISVFYGATDAGIAVAEVRPPGGSRVGVARFEILRPVKLLDVEALRSVLVKGSLFDTSFLGRLEHAKFLEHLSHRITAPVMPSDEPFDYLPTQVIADYLATRIALDGIVYPSAQGKPGKRNVALFHHAARVQPLALPEGTVLSARLDTWSDEGVEVDYSVLEEVPKIARSKKSKTFSPRLGVESLQADSDQRESTLRVEPNAMHVHHVQSVTVKTTAYPVQRHRTVKRKLPF